MLAAQLGAGMRAAEIVDRVEADPARDEAEIAVAGIIQVVRLRRRAEEQRTGRRLERPGHKGVQRQRQLLLEEAEDRGALMDVEQ